MSCPGNNVITAWAGDNTAISVDFYTDAEQRTARVFDASATVVWHIINSGGTSSGTFAGAVETGALGVKHRITGTITGGAPAAGTYSLYAVVTADGKSETVPSPPAGSLLLEVTADPIPAS